MGDLHSFNRTAFVRATLNTVRRRDADAAISLLKRRIWHSDPPPADPPAPPAPPAPASGSSADTEPTEDPKWLAKRLRKAEEAKERKLLEDLGVDNIDAVKALLAADKKRREDEMTEVQKAATEKEKAEARALKAEADLENERKGRRADLRDGKVKDALVASNAKADKVLKLLKVDKADALDALLKDDGSVDEAKLKTLVEDAKKTYPEDFGNGQRGYGGSPSTNGGRAPDLGKDREKRASQMNQRRIRG